MKKILFSLAVMLTTVLSASAMSYDQARDQALFLTDKMAYELDLTEDQYEAAYEVNLDYLMSVESANDCFSDYWTHRNLDLSYILYDWQYRTFCGLDYFYRPLYWDDGFWHFRIYAHYPHHDYFYFGHPGFWGSYRGGHAWHNNGGRSWYHGRSFGRSGAIGMRGGWDRGGYRNMSRGWRPNDGGNRGFNRNSAVRGGGNNRSIGNNRGGSSMNRGGSSVNRGGSSTNRGGSNSGMSRQSSTRQNSGSSASRGGSYSPSRSFSSGSSSSSRSSMGGSSSSSRSSMGGSSRSSMGGGSSSSHGGGSSMGGHSGGSSMGGSSHGGGGSHGGGHGGH